MLDGKNPKLFHYSVFSIFHDFFLSASLFITLPMSLYKKILNRDNTIHDVKTDLDNLKYSYRELRDLYFEKIKPRRKEYLYTGSINYLIGPVFGTKCAYLNIFPHLISMLWYNTVL